MSLLKPLGRGCELLPDNMDNRIHLGNKDNMDDIDSIDDINDVANTHQMPI